MRFPFFKKNPIEKLQKQYRQLLQESHRLSTINRRESDQKLKEAEEIAAKIDALKG